MRQLKLSRSELADRAGISRGYVSDLLNGKRGGRLGADVMLNLAKALEVEPIFFRFLFRKCETKKPIWSHFWPGREDDRCRT